MLSERGAGPGDHSAPKAPCLCDCSPCAGLATCDFIPEQPLRWNRPSGLQFSCQAAWPNSYQHVKQMRWRGGEAEPARGLC